MPGLYPPSAWASRAVLAARCSLDNRPLAPNIAPDLVQAGTPGSNADEPTDGEARKPKEGRRAKVPDNKALRQPLNATDKRCQTGRYRTRTCDFIRVRDSADTAKGTAHQGVTSSCQGACTNACTSEGENGRFHAHRLEVIAELLTNLPAAERAEVIGGLSPDDRLAVAQFLATQPVRESEEQAQHKG